VSAFTKGVALKTLVVVLVLLENGV